MRLNVGQIPGTVLPFHKLVLVALGAKGRETSTCHGRTLLSIIYRYDRMRKGGTRGRLTDMERAMRKPTSRFASVCGVVAVLCLSGLRRAQDFVPVTDQMLLDPDPADCLMVHRTYDFQGFSPLNQIDRSNVDQLQLAWMRAMDEGPQEIRPLVYDGVMYIAHPNGDHIQALDATTGDLLWNYERDLPDDLREYARLGGRTRHLAIYGEYIYHLTADAYLIALDARTGELAWETEMADYRDGITHSSGAMIIKGQVVTGRTCSPSSLEARCFVAAHDADTGNELWRTYTAAGADDPGGETWGNLPTARRVHVSPWGLPGSYDPELNRVFWGIAVPLPYPRLVRRGTWDVGDRIPQCELIRIRRKFRIR